MGNLEYTLIAFVIVSSLAIALAVFLSEYLLYRYDHEVRTAGINIASRYRRYKAVSTPEMIIGRYIFGSSHSGTGQTHGKSGIYPDRICDCVIAGDTACGISQRIYLKNCNPNYFYLKIKISSIGASTALAISTASLRDGLYCAFSKRIIVSRRNLLSLLCFFIPAFTAGGNGESAVVCSIVNK